jgi:hypothetical protein
MPLAAWALNGEGARQACGTPKFDEATPRPSILILLGNPLLFAA